MPTFVKIIKSYMGQKFKIGDFVILKKGSSPKIVLDDRLGEDMNGLDCFNGTYQCGWYVKDDIILKIISQEELLQTERAIVSF
jgi:uncharacterized protein YodC (DUF2158 family)